MAILGLAGLAAWVGVRLGFIFCSTFSFPLTIKLGRRVQGISRNYAQKLRGEFQATTPEIQESPSVFSRGWPNIEKLGRHVREHLPSSPAWPWISRWHLNAYVYLSASTPPPPRKPSQAKPNHAANSARKVSMHFYATSKCIWQHVLVKPKHDCIHTYIQLYTHLHVDKPSQAMLPTPPVKSPCISKRLLNAYGNMYWSTDAHATYWVILSHLHTSGRPHGGEGASPGPPPPIHPQHEWPANSSK